MEECCIVCAEPLEWVGYGVCGHQDVCSTCIARLRFILNDRQCCICKQECPSVFVTKALGNFTKVVDNFETLSEQRDLFYDSNLQAYFDDEKHYSMIKAMCRLSCSICEKTEAAGKDFVRKGFVFRNLDLLRRHLAHVHKVRMCSLCLEGRKVFICEQKLYSKQQIERHLLHGDSEIDGNDEDRGGFTGHPLCKFCRRRFYSDNELYQHMSTDHYTCHICQRLHPGRYDYYNNYDDLEAHFRHAHVLCEHPDCLAQKFVVFTSEAELKRHTALVHGGNMSKAQRNAALQIPVSFQYRRPGQVHRGGGSSRRREGRFNGELSTEPQVDDGQVRRNYPSDELVTSVNTTNIPQLQNNEIVAPTLSLMQASQSSATTESSNALTEPPRYLAAVSGSGPSSLRVSAFPPLPGSDNAPQLPKQMPRGSAVSMATLLSGGEVRRSSKMQQGRSEGESPSKLPMSGLLNQSPHVSNSQQPNRHLEFDRTFPSLLGETSTHVNDRVLGPAPVLSEASSSGSMTSKKFEVSKNGSSDGNNVKSTVDDLDRLQLTPGGALDDSEVEVLSKDGYQDLKGKKKDGTSKNELSLKENIDNSNPVKALVSARKSLEMDDSSISKEAWNCAVCTLENKGYSSHCVACGAACSDVKPERPEVEASGKKKKKSVVKLRFGDGSTATFLDSGKKAWQSDPEANTSTSGAHGVWQKGGL